MWRTGTTRTTDRALTVPHGPSFCYFVVAPALVVRQLCGLVCGIYFSLCKTPLSRDASIFSNSRFRLALVRQSVGVFHLSRATAPFCSPLEAVPCCGSATLTQVFWAISRNVCHCDKLEMGQAAWAGNSLWFKALRGSKNDVLCGGFCGSPLMPGRFLMSQMRGQWPPMRCVCETCAALHVTGGVLKFTTTLFSSVIAGVICRVKKNGWWPHHLLVRDTQACFCVSQQRVGLRLPLVSVRALL